MKKRHFTGLIFLIFPLLAFQCGQWAKYIRNIETKVTPEVIELSNDTISFQIHLEPKNYRANKNETIVFMLYAMADGDNELISKIEETFESPLDKPILGLLETNRRIENLGLRLQRYQGDKLKLDSPILPIAIIEDSR